MGVDIRLAENGFLVTVHMSNFDDTQYVEKTLSGAIKQLKAALGE